MLQNVAHSYSWSLTFLPHVRNLFKLGLDLGREWASLHITHFAACLQSTVDIVDIVDIVDTLDSPDTYLLSPSFNFAVLPGLSVISILWFGLKHKSHANFQ